MIAGISDMYYLDGARHGASCLLKQQLHGHLYVLQQIAGEWGSVPSITCIHVGLDSFQRELMVNLLAASQLIMSVTRYKG